MESWLAQNGQDRGFVGTAQDFYDMSKDWYAGRIEEDWEVPSAAQRKALLDRHGFTGDFWALG